MYKVDSSGYWTEVVIKREKDKLIDTYTKLYNKLWGGTNGLWSGDLERLDDKSLRKEIKEMRKAIKDKDSYYPGLSKTPQI